MDLQFDRKIHKFQKIYFKQQNKSTDSTGIYCAVYNINCCLKETIIPIVKAKHNRLSKINSLYN